MAKTKMPYKVVVKDNNGEIQVTVRPQPVAVKQDQTTVVAGRFQRILTSEDVRNTMTGRSKLKKELERALQDFHDQKMIQPRDEKEKDERF